MSHKSELLKQIHKLSEKLHFESKWYDRNEPFGHTNNDSEDDYIYEFYCYLKILKDLKTHYKIKYDKGNKGFPTKPAKKEGYSKFLLLDKNSNNKLFQVCAGTKIIKHNGKVSDTDAPDISFQKSDANDNPNYNDVLMIMDAKYKLNPSKKLTKPIIEQFATIVRDLKVENANTEPINFDNYKDLKGNCLITNGLAHKKKETYCKNNFIKQVEKFDIGSTPNVIG